MRGLNARAFGACVITSGTYLAPLEGPSFLRILVQALTGVASKLGEK
jgi:hypothetical protein